MQISKDIEMFEMFLHSILDRCVENIPHTYIFPIFGKMFYKSDLFAIAVGETGRLGDLNSNS